MAGCFVRQTGSGAELRYDYDRRGGGYYLSRTEHDDVTGVQAKYSADDRLIRLTDPALGSYIISYQTGTHGSVVRADVRDPDGTLRRITLDETGYWFSRWGSYRGR